MPCNSDYLEATPLEKETSIVTALLEELKTGMLPSYYGDGYNANFYGCSTKTMLDEKTADLCARLKKSARIAKMSLEMQIWWRNHQEHDRRRKRQALLDIEDKTARKAALNKLTPRERKLLGI